MLLKSIEIQNYRCHRQLSVEFNGSFNAIIGLNGSGKTALLNGVCDALAGWANYFHLKTGMFQPMAEDNVPRLQVNYESGRFRFEPQYPVIVSAETIGGSSWFITKRLATDAARIEGAAPGASWAGRDPLHFGISRSATDISLPIIAYFRANRAWRTLAPNELQAVTVRNSRLDGYVSWWDASTDASAMQGWFIAKSIERLQRSSDLSDAAPADIVDELSLVNSAITEAINEIKGIRYDFIAKSILIEWRDGVSDASAFENLSDGQRAAVCLIGDIARRMCLLNPHLGDAIARETSGIVLIDELDVHLHPRWQRLLVQGLRNAFPKVQFIVTSHSPQVLSELSPDEIILLRPSGVARPQVSYGMDSSSVLDEIMEASARPIEIQNLLTKLFESIERNELSYARAQLSRLRELAPGVSELAGAAALLKRKELVGR